jgi:hypothetical protein
MGYLNNSTITVDAILTKKGRELLARNRNEFRITQFALSDDEIDYDLWNPAHPNGSDFYGVVIENMPITEAVPDETLNLKYKLITLPRNTPVIPVLKANVERLTFSGEGQKVIEPTTLNFVGANSTLGYTFILGDNTVADIVDVTGVSGLSYISKADTTAASGGVDINDNKWILFDNPVTHIKLRAGSFWVFYQNI